MPRPRRFKPAVAGERVGTKKRDMRWVVDGVTWASRFEYQVFSTLREKGIDVRKTTAVDQMEYTAPVVNGRCEVCGGVHVVTVRKYTPDLHVLPGKGQQAGYFIEAKGYLRADKRSLLRAWRKAHPNVDLRLVIQRDYPVTAKLKMSEWAAKFLKGVKVHVWNGDIPEDWK